MFDDVLIESSNKLQTRGGWKTTVISLALHALAIGAVVGAGYYVKENPEVIEKPIQAFIAQAAPPPPPAPASPGIERAAADAHAHRGAADDSSRVVRHAPGDSAGDSSGIR